MVRFILSDGAVKTGEILSVEDHDTYATVVVEDSRGRIHRVASVDNAGRQTVWVD